MPAIRPAHARDAAPIRAILAAEITGAWRHFGEVVPDEAALVDAIAEAAPHVWLVAEVDGDVVGFARSSPHKAREAYAWTAEIGVYLAAGHRGQGVGRALVGALIDALRAAGFRTLLAGIALPNPASVALFERLGFRACGTLPRVGHKHGAWRDVGYWALHVGEGPPAAPPRAEAPTWLPFVQVDAFAERPFEGNPAAVMRLPYWLDDATLAALAREHNLSETAFVVREPRGLHLRWFTPSVEVDLCGHATLAAGFAILAEDGGDRVDFHTRSGRLTVRREAEGLALELPSHPPGASGLPEAVAAALGCPPEEGFAIKALHHADYFLAVYAREADIRALAPDTSALRRSRANVICTAPGASVDFVSRFFAPASGVDEDPVTGSAHATLTPFWAERLGVNPLRAHQISARGGRLRCRLEGERVVLVASCVEVLRGQVRLP